MYRKIVFVGISSTPNVSLTSLLGNREQRVSIAQSYSDVKHVNAGVPQGSVLGSPLFLVYVNDITQNILSITRLFADDTSLDRKSVV